MAKLETPSMVAFFVLGRGVRWGGRILFLSQSDPLTYTEVDPTTGQSPTLRTNYLLHAFSATMAMNAGTLTDVVEVKNVLCLCRTERSAA